MLTTCHQNFYYVIIKRTSHFRNGCRTKPVVRN